MLYKHMANKDKNKLHQNEYLVYNRKSTDDAENQKNSLAYQESENLKFAKKQNLTVANLTTPNFCTNGVISESHSGYKESDDFVINADGSIQYRIDRPKFSKLIGILNNHEIRGVIFLCWDRASRNKQDDVLIKKLIKLGCDIRFSQAQYDKTSSGDLHMDIDGMFSSHYSRVISEKVKNASVKLRAEGRCLFFSPIGFLDEGSDNKTLDPVRAPIVKRIFELYATGDYSFRELAKWANTQGLTTKPVRRKRTQDQILSNVAPDIIPKTSQPVSHKSIENILKNPFYIGKNRTKDGYVDATSHHPLIDMGLYNKVQEVLKSKNVSVYYFDKKFSTFRGIVRCSCGRAFSSYEQKGIIYYRTRCASGCDNPNKNLKESDIHKVVQLLMDQIYFSDDELKEIQEQAHTGLDNISQKRDKALQDLYIQQKRVFADLDYITKNRITLLRTSSMSIEQVKSEEDRLGTELNTITSKINIYGETAQEMIAFVMTFSELVKNASLHYKFALDSERRELVSAMFTELVFKNGKLEKYTAKEGFEALLNRAVLSGSATRARTWDILLNREALYRLSYRRMFAFFLRIFILAKNTGKANNRCKRAVVV